MQVESLRKTIKSNDTERIRYRKLYVVKDEYIADIANGIREDIPKFQQYVGNLKADGYEVIGYVRKSHGDEDKDTRIRLLQTMMDKMLERLLVDKIFVSPMSHAGEPFGSRDVNYDIIKPVHTLCSSSFVFP
ncbi:uncharacterized protein EV154DRAFT_494181 [Mucor mucedo]|uniref:uncharacterized protein n=1 Tax=Mucor mucedo TaxID=29922 RepID=UPI00222018B1|nr:uncharacterized protein EV154DRAFT_494181 [Mucor mucedo]KAI7895915.1 hypothetical protein EV154DRAFT_494181 [Mucor mucedo]